MRIASIDLGHSSENGLNYSKASLFKFFLYLGHARAYDKYNVTWSLFPHISDIRAGPVYSQNITQPVILMHVQVSLSARAA